MDVRFRLWDSTETSILYTFPIVFSANYPHSEKHLIEHSSPRAKGSLVLDGGIAAWDLVLQGVLMADDYQALMALADALESAVALNTPYILNINKTVSTYYSYHVKRIVPIEYADNIKTDFLEYKITFRVNSW
jgi:prophage DNA circulation protein